MEIRKSESSKNGPWSEASCQIRLDRLVVGVTDRLSLIPQPTGFRRVQDIRVRPQGAIATYGRVCRYQSESSSACKVSIQYQPQCPWLPTYRITVIGDDETGITPGELKQILIDCPDHVVSLVELAFDFHPDTLMDEDFVLTCGRFGKSRRQRNRGGPGMLRYGSRGSSKLVRCYRKRPIGNRYRVELEMHSALLRKYSIRNIADLPDLAGKLCPSHICFKVLRWQNLEAHLVRVYGTRKGERLCDEAKEHAQISFRRVNRFLSKAIYNPHRFWASEITTRQIREALKRWAQQFADSMDEL